MSKGGKSDEITCSWSGATQQGKEQEDAGRCGQAGAQLRSSRPGSCAVIEARGAQPPPRALVIAMLNEMTRDAHKPRDRGGRVRERDQAHDQRAGQHEVRRGQFQRCRCRLPWRRDGRAGEGLDFTVDVASSVGAFQT